MKFKDAITNNWIEVNTFVGVKIEVEQTSWPEDQGKFYIKYFVKIYSEDSFYAVGTYHTSKFIHEALKARDTVEKLFLNI